MPIENPYKLSESNFMSLYAPYHAAQIISIPSFFLPFKKPQIFRVPCSNKSTFCITLGTIFITYCIYRDCTNRLFIESTVLGPSVPSCYDDNHKDNLVATQHIEKIFTKHWGNATIVEEH